MNVINLIYSEKSNDCCIKIQHNVGNVDSSDKIKFYNKGKYSDYIYYSELTKFCILKIIKDINKNRYIVRNINILSKIPEEYYDT